jgi:hypothetical protein
MSFTHLTAHDMTPSDRSLAGRRLTEAMTAADPSSSVLQLARTLRDEGMGQVTMYRLFSEELHRLSGDDPRYDAIADTLDLIWGGPWAKGRALFNEELTSEHIDRE